jgi:excisionase family DNA binding protein
VEERLAFRPNEAAKITGQGRTTIFQDIKDGKLRAVKNGRRTLILRCDLEQYLRGMPHRAAYLTGIVIVLGAVAFLSLAAHRLPPREFAHECFDNQLSDFHVRVAERTERKGAGINKRVLAPLSSTGWPNTSDGDWVA